MTDPNPAPLVLNLADESATAALGVALARALEPGLRIYLRGPLGAGKTTLVRAVLRGLGHPGRVKSPTYTLVELYSLSRLNLYHFDFYRFRDRDEWRDAGFSEYFNHENVCLVEWPEKAGDELLPADLDIAIEIISHDSVIRSTPQSQSDSPDLNATQRRAVLTAHTPAGQKCLSSIVHFKSPNASS